MRSEDVTVLNPTGLHARPANAFVKAARSFASSIRLVNANRSADGKSLLAILKVGASCGSHLRIEADGPDEDMAIEALVALLRSFDD